MSETVTDAGGLFRAGRLDEAIAAANLAVRGAPAAFAPRILLAELLLFAGNLERADVILAAAGDIEPPAAAAVAAFRQLIRAETARRQLRSEGRLPEFLGSPTPALAAALDALCASARAMPPPRSPRPSGRRRCGRAPAATPRASPSMTCATRMISMPGSSRC